MGAFFCMHLNHISVWNYISRLDVKIQGLNTSVQSHLDC